MIFVWIEFGHFDELGDDAFISAPIMCAIRPDLTEGIHRLVSEQFDDFRVVLAGGPQLAIEIIEGRMMQVRCRRERIERAHFRVIAIARTSSPLSLFMSALSSSTDAAVICTSMIMSLMRFVVPLCDSWERLALLRRWWDAELRYIVITV